MIGWKQLSRKPFRQNCLSILYNILVWVKIINQYQFDELTFEYIKKHRKYHHALKMNITGVPHLHSKVNSK